MTHNAVPNTHVARFDAGSLHSRVASKVTATADENPRKGVHDAASVAGTAGSRGPFRASDTPVESEDAALHFRRALRHLHHRSPEDVAADPGGAGEAA